MYDYSVKFWVRSEYIKYLLILGVVGCCLLMLILFAGCYIILWVMMLTFQRYRLPPSSGLESAVCWVSVCARVQYLLFWNGIVEGRIEWWLVPRQYQVNYCLTPAMGWVAWSMMEKSPWSNSRLLQGGEGRNKHPEGYILEVRWAYTGTIGRLRFVLGKGKGEGERPPLRSCNYSCIWHIICGQSMWCTLCCLTIGMTYIFIKYIPVVVILIYAGKYNVLFLAVL
jgi:hypothetical protein